MTPIEQFLRGERGLGELTDAERCRLSTGKSTSLLSGGCQCCSRFLEPDSQASHTVIVIRGGHSEFRVCRFCAKELRRQLGEYV